MQARPAKVRSEWIFWEKILWKERKENGNWNQCSLLKNDKETSKEIKQEQNGNSRQTKNKQNSNKDS